MIVETSVEKSCPNRGNENRAKALSRGSLRSAAIANLRAGRTFLPKGGLCERLRRPGRGLLTEVGRRQPELLGMETFEPVSSLVWNSIDL